MTKITPEHLGRQAIVYIRQSTADQVANNLESQRRQCSRTVAVGRHYGWAKRYGARSILSAAVLTCGQGEGRDGDRPQDRGLILQHPSARHELQGPGC